MPAALWQTERHLKLRFGEQPRYSGRITLAGTLTLPLQPASEADSRVESDAALFTTDFFGDRCDDH